MTDFDFTFCKLINCPCFSYNKNGEKECKESSFSCQYTAKFLLWFLKDKKLKIVKDEKENNA